MAEQVSFDTQVRLLLYREFVDHSRAPEVARLAALLAAPMADVRAALERLHTGKAIVLQPDSRRIMMANPLCAVPTCYAVYVEQKMYFGTCAWDALGILAMLNANGVVETSCPCCGEGMTITIVNGHPLLTQGLIHFAIPARQWWENIVFT